MNPYPSPSNHSVSGVPLQPSTDVMFTKSPPSFFPYHHRHHYYYFPGSSSSSNQAPPFLLPPPYPPFPSPSQSSPPLSQHYYPMDHHHHHHCSHSSPRSHPSSSSTVASVVPSPPSSCPSSSAASNHLRYEVILEAPTAAAQKIEDAPLTYLNKGQYYTINLTDSVQYDGEITSTITIMFHDESHRKVAVDFWKFWMSQQKDQDSARAIDIDTNRSNGAFNIQCQFFDSISFRWNGKAGASICLRFHFLSTDFSRIKGVKGIPLRLHIATKAVVPSGPNPAMSGGAESDDAPAERSYCQIKLFRDKGAERKNKDDARHIEKQLEKLRGKNGEPHPLWLAYLQTQPYTVFCAVPSSSPVPSTSGSGLTHPGFQQQQQQQHRLSPYPGGNGVAATAGTMMPSPGNIISPSLGHPPLHPYGAGGGGPGILGMKRDHPDAVGMFASPSAQSPSNLSPYFMQQPIVDVDPNYVPQQRRRFAKLSLFVKFPNEGLHRAIYLDQLSAEDLKEKLACKLGQADDKNIHRIKDVVRCVANKENVIVRVDDALVSGMIEEQVMEVEPRANEDGTTTLVLHY